MNQKVSIFECDDQGKRILSEEIIKLFQEKGVTEVKIIKLLRLHCFRLGICTVGQGFTPAVFVLRL